MKNILLVDDDKEVSQSLANLFDPEKFTFDFLDDGDRVSAYIADHSDDVDVVMLDVNLPSMSGLDVLKQIKEVDSDMPVIMISGFVSTENAIEAMREGAFEYLTKPFQIEKLIDTVNKAFIEFPQFLPHRLNLFVESANVTPFCALNILRIVIYLTFERIVGILGALFGVRVHRFYLGPLIVHHRPPRATSLPPVPNHGVDWSMMPRMVSRASCASVGHALTIRPKPESSNDRAEWSSTAPTVAPLFSESSVSELENAGCSTPTGRASLTPIGNLSWFITPFGYAGLF